MTVNPDFSAVAPCPMSRAPDVVAAAHVIPRTARIVRPITNLDRDGAWVRSIPWITWPVRARISVIRPAIVPWVIAVITGASACADRDENNKEQERRPIRSHSRSIPGGDRLHLRLINNVQFHIIYIRIRLSSHAPEFKNFRRRLENLAERLPDTASHSTQLDLAKSSRLCAL